MTTPQPTPQSTPPQSIPPQPTPVVAVTTAISYPNGPLHLGHAYEAILADAWRRYQELCGHPTWFCTGTDDHGWKVQATAEQVGKTPQAMCDEYSSQYQSQLQRFDIKYDYWMRTSSSFHHHFVHNILQQLRPWIYQKPCRGVYHKNEERFLQAHEMVHVNLSQLPAHLHCVEMEQAYFFRLSAWKPSLKTWWSKKSRMEPISLQSKVIDDLERLEDVCISMTDPVTWGIPFHSNDLALHQVVYVWIDALLNYVSAVRAHHMESVEFYHWIGADILWFHAILYPALLMAANLNQYLPQKLLVHGLLLDEQGYKMSKTLHNGVDLEQLARLPKDHTVQGLRYYLLRHADWGAPIRVNINQVIPAHQLSLSVLNQQLQQQVHINIPPHEPDYQIQCAKHALQAIQDIVTCKRSIGELVRLLEQEVNEITVMVTYDWPKALVRFYFCTLLYYPIVPTLVNEIRTMWQWVPASRSAFETLKLMPIQPIQPNSHNIVSNR